MQQAEESISHSCKYILEEDNKLGLYVCPSDRLSERADLRYYISLISKHLSTLYNSLGGMSKLFLGE